MVLILFYSDQEYNIISYDDIEYLVHYLFGFTAGPADPLHPLLLQWGRAVSDLPFPLRGPHVGNIFFEIVFPSILSLSYVISTFDGNF